MTLPEGDESAMWLRGGSPQARSQDENPIYSQL